MGLMNLLFGGETAAYDVTIYYKCRNCNKTLPMGNHRVNIKLNKHDGKPELQDKIIQYLLYPNGNKPMNGYVIHYGHSTNSTYFPIQPHNCCDSKVGISEFAALDIIRAPDSQLPRS